MHPVISMILFVRQFDWLYYTFHFCFNGGTEHLRSAVAIKKGYLPWCALKNSQYLNKPERLQSCNLLSFVQSDFRPH